MLIQYILGEKKCGMIFSQLQLHVVSFYPTGIQKSNKIKINIELLKNGNLGFGVKADFLDTDTGVLPKKKI